MPKPDDKPAKPDKPEKLPKGGKDLMQCAAIIAAGMLAGGTSAGDLDAKVAVALAVEVRDAVLALDDPPADDEEPTTPAGEAASE